MISLDITSGIIDLGPFKLGPLTLLNDLTILKEHYNIIPGVVNAGYHSVSIPDINEETAVGITFFETKLWSVGIFCSDKNDDTPWTITEEKRASTQKLLKGFGGDGIYAWGRIFYNEDHKAGIVNVMVSYEPTMLD